MAPVRPALSSPVTNFNAPSKLSDITQFNDAPPWMLRIVLADIGGGRMTATDLAQIDAAPPSTTALVISGLDQPMFEMLVGRYGYRFTAIYFWKCPRIEDLTPLEALPSLTYVAFYWNQRATKLWNFAATPKLRGLQWQDFSRLHALDDLAAGSSLEELRFGDAVWTKSVFVSLAPLQPLTRLRRLDFDARRIEDGRVQPLVSLPSLESLDFPLRMFTTEQCAWLRAHLRDSVRGRALVPVSSLDKPIGSKDTFVIGKGQPFLNSKTDRARIARYTEAFWALVEKYRSDPTLEPPTR
jgi:hypothetical protein